MRAVIYKDRGVWLILFDGDVCVAFHRLSDVRHCIWQIANALVGVIRSTQYGNFVDDQNIDLSGRSAGCLVLKYAVGRPDVRIELREYNRHSVLGYFPPNETYRTIHERLMTAGAFADLLRDILLKLGQDELGRIAEEDPLLLKGVADALDIYARERPRLNSPVPWMRRATELAAA